MRRASVRCGRRYRVLAAASGAGDSDEPCSAGLGSRRCLRRSPAAAGGRRTARRRLFPEAAPGGAHAAASAHLLARQEPGTGVRRTRCGRTRPRRQAASPARVHLMGHSFGTIVVSGAIRGPGKTPQPPPRPVSSLFLGAGRRVAWAFAGDVPDEDRRRAGLPRRRRHAEIRLGTHRRHAFEWDYAVGRFYPLAVGIAGQYLFGETRRRSTAESAPSESRVTGAVELPAQGQLARPRLKFAGSTVYNIDASEVIAQLDGASGAHTDLGASRAVRLGWNAARGRRDVREAQATELLRMAVPVFGDADVKLRGNPFEPIERLDAQRGRCAPTSRRREPL